VFEKNMRLSFLLDFYGEVLDEHARKIAKAYFEEDLSLSEIASLEGISRQGVRHIVKKCEEQLKFLEEKLGLAARFSEIEDATKKLKVIADKLSESDDRSLCEYSSQILDVIDRIT